MTPEERYGRSDDNGLLSGRPMSVNVTHVDPYRNDDRVSVPIVLLIALVGLAAMGTGVVVMFLFQLR